MKPHSWRQISLLTLRTQLQIQLGGDEKEVLGDKTALGDPKFFVNETMQV